MSKTVLKILTITILCLFMLFMITKKVSATDNKTDFEKLMEIDDEKRLTDFGGNTNKYLEYMQGTEGQLLRKLKGMYNYNKTSADTYNGEGSVRQIKENFVNAVENAHIFINSETELWEMLKENDGKCYAIPDSTLVKYINLLCTNSDLPYGAVTLYQKTGQVDVYVYDDDSSETAQITDEDKIIFHHGNELRSRHK